MGLNDTPSGERIHIGFFGRRNAGKSSVVNAVTGQELAVVSDTKGTTTDPVSKAMELLPLGPVMIIDTPGFDDEGHLGELRVRKTKQILNRTDIAVLVIDSTQGVKQCEEELLAIFKEKEIPYLLVYNKEDILSEEQKNLLRTEQSEQINSICVSALEKKHINELKEKTGTSVMMITHDLGVIAEVADDVMVMYAGKVVEHASCDQIFDKPMHPYTDGLMKCIPKLDDDDTKELSVIKGMVPSFDDMPAGCAFCPRCPQAREICRQKMPELVEAEGRKVRCFKYTKEWEENI